MPKPHIHSLVIAALGLLVGGCLPEGFVWWSPDGQTAAVRAPDGLRLAGTNGQLSAVVMPGDIGSAAWLPDGSGLVVIRSFKLTNWAQAERMLPREEADTVVQMAHALPDLVKAGLIASGGSSEALEERFLKPLGMTDSPWLEPAWNCALLLHRAQLLSVVAGFTNAATLETEIRTSGTNGIAIYEISILDIRERQPVGRPRVLLRSVRPLLDPLPSPHHAILAFRTGDRTLKAMTLDNTSSAVAVGEDVSSAAWSVDGQALLHIAMGKTDTMGEIRSRAVVDDAGALLTNAPAVETLAVAAFAAGGAPRLSVLPDGRLLFASMPVTLPMRASSIHVGARFFLLDPMKRRDAPVVVTLQEGSLPDDLSTFATSPDGRFVAVAEAGTDTVAILELATGKVSILSASKAGWKTRMIPAWRNPRELTFAGRFSPTAVRPELLLWNVGSPLRVLSSAWPDEVVKPWMEVPGASGPAAQK